MFHYVENVFSTRVLDILTSKYCKILPTDNSSYEVWSSLMTDDNKLPEAFSTTIQGPDRMNIILDLFSNERLPFYKDQQTKFAQIAVQKLLPTCYIPEHNDTCRASLTVFLNEDVTGGEFEWQGNGIKVIIPPKFNCGVYAYNDVVLTGANHKTLPVTGKNNRYTLQMFLN